MSAWFSVKGLFRWYLKKNRETDRIEERIVLFQADGFDEALDKAEQEARKYCKADRSANFRIEPIGWWYAYEILDDLADGAELYSERTVTKSSGEAFVRRYYPATHKEK